MKSWKVKLHILQVNWTLTIDGTVSVDGHPGEAKGGGGSGGGVYLEADVFMGDGQVSSLSGYRTTHIHL